MEQAIRDLQSMLTAISQVHREIPRLQADGQLGEKTLEAVMIFQRQTDLPVTGEVDQATWESIVQTHADVRKQLAPPRPVSLLPHHGADLLPGQFTPLLYPIQGMFLALSQMFGPVREVPVSGHLDEDTVHNIRWIQSKGPREETGILDKDTWEDLSRLYETFITRNPDHQP